MRSMRLKLIVIGLGLQLVFQTGCLQTRTSMRDQEEKQVLRKTVQHLQQNTADVTTRFSDIDEDLRRLTGRIEVTENRIQQIQQKIDNSDMSADVRTKETSERLQIYQDAITKLDSQVVELNRMVAQMQEDMRRQASSGSAGKTARGAKVSGPYAEAEALFKKNAWKDAILAYEKYRKENPKGKQFPDATYKIGVCFQELGMTEEAKAFYEEVIAKFPKAKEADKANYRLKNLKKK